MDRWQAMRVFVKVSESGGFAEAARRLFMSPPAVTRAVAFLEDAIGAQLLVRTTRSLKLTETGERYLHDCQRILADLADAEAAAAGSYTTPTGTLIVTAPVMFGQLHILPVVMDYLGQHPVVSAQTLFLDRITNLVEEGMDVAIRISHLPDSELTAIRVGSMRRVVCASPAYLAEHGEPRSPADLAGHSVIARIGAWPRLEWRFGREEKTHVGIQPRLMCNLNESGISAAISGWGLVRVFAYQVDTALREGTLRTVLTEFEEAPVPVHIVHAGGRAPSAKVRSFVDFAVERLRANPIFGDLAQSRLSS
ncbi:LysR family transcriptional regulator [Labrys sp. KB_33_2]|uniref:LysR family transcriptional regulator n=1 Tax=Labrys sp. KB_33_2 TaxID=3237479 RepID=UPI003F913316